MAFQLRSIWNRSEESVVETQTMSGKAYLILKAVLTEIVLKAGTPSFGFKGAKVDHSMIRGLERQ